MRRVGLVLASVCMIALVSGCGGKEKKLECTMSADETGISTKQVMTLEFDKKDKYKTGSLKQDYVLGKDLLKNTDLETYEKTIENSVLKTQFDGMDYKISNNGKDTISINLNISEKDMQKLTNSKNLTGSDSVKEAFEEVGYTCKVN